MTNEQQQSPKFRLDKLKKHLYNTIWGIKQLLTCGHTHLSNIPIRFGEFNDAHPCPRNGTRKLLNSELACYALETQWFDWAVYSFSNGHFPSTIMSHNLPFNVCLVCNPYESGRALFHEFTRSAKVFSSGNDLLNHIRASGDTSVVHGYLVNSYRFQTSEVTTSFWKLQLSIIAQLRLIRLLSVVVAIVIRDHNGRSVSAFTRGLTSAHWKVSSRDVSFTLHQHRQHCCRLLQYHYCVSFVLRQHRLTDRTEDFPSSKPTANWVIHLGAL
jgi:hypothetical protein